MHSRVLAGIEAGIEQKLAHALFLILHILPLQRQRALGCGQGSGELEFARGLAAQPGP
ncbi:hypothetical protein D3C84_1276940 [compost metagenome]